jgi:hypothetical protein
MSSSAPRLRLAGLVAGGLLAAVAFAGADPAGAAVRQPDCVAQEKKLKKAKGKKRAAAKAALTQCRANLTVYKQVKDVHLVGARGDGQSIDALYCANGKWTSRVGNGVSKGTGWRIVDADPKAKATKFSAIVESPEKGGRHVQGVIRNGAKWQVGYESFGEVKSPGDVVASSGTELCAAL